jgi:hypothetical protein
MSFCIPALARHVSRLNETDCRVLLGSLDKELSRLNKHEEAALPKEVTAAKGDDAGVAPPGKVMVPGEPVRYQKLLAVTKNLVLDTLTAERTDTGFGSYG